MNTTIEIDSDPSKDEHWTNETPDLHFGLGFPRERLPDGWMLMEGPEDYALALSPCGRYHGLGKDGAYAKDHSGNYYRQVLAFDPPAECTFSATSCANLARRHFLYDEHFDPLKMLREGTGFHRAIVAEIAGMITQ